MPALLFLLHGCRLGLIYLRVPTWSPFRLQFYCNGHSWLARQLTAEGIGYTMADNAFMRIDDWSRAQQLADGLSPDQFIGPSIVMPNSAARYPTCSGNPITGA